MAAIKLILFLCVAVFYTYARVPDLGQQRLDHQLKDAESTAIEHLNLLKETIESAINGAMILINGSLEVLNNAVQAIIVDTQENLDATVTPFLTDIKGLQNVAAQVGVNITDCVGNSTAQLNALPIGFLSKVSSCMDTKVTATKEYVNQSIISLNSSLDIISDLTDQIYVCGNESSQLQTICFEGLELKITEYTASIPVQITIDGYNVKVYVYQAVPQIALCSAGMIEDLEGEGAAIDAKVTACALAKINGTTAKPFDIFV